MGYYSADDASRAFWKLGASAKACLAAWQDRSPEVHAEYEAARTRAVAIAVEGAEHQDDHTRDTRKLLAAGWRRVPWVRIGDGSSDWIAPDGRRLSREDALAEVPC